MNNFINHLIDKYWKNYQSETIGAGFSYSISEDIKKEIDQYIKENLPYQYSYDEYKNDTDEYVKYSAQHEILKLLMKVLEQNNRFQNYPKRFEHSYGPRD